MASRIAGRHKESRLPAPGFCPATWLRHFGRGLVRHGLPIAFEPPRSIQTFGDDADTVETIGSPSSKGGSPSARRFALSFGALAWVWDSGLA